MPRSSLFSSSRRLGQAFAGIRPLRAGETSGGVFALQAALKTLRYPMPKTFRRGRPDCVFGPETKAAVAMFQSDRGLAADGVAGPRTLSALDAVLPPESKPRRRPDQWFTDTVATDNRKSTRFALLAGDPPHTPDEGAGRWGSEPLELTTVTLHWLLSEPEVMATLGSRYGKDAERHLRHFIENSGLALMIPADRIVKEVASVGLAYDALLADAVAFSETLGEGIWRFRQAEADTGYAWPAESVNWFYAIGGFRYWMSGVASVTKQSITLNTAFTISDRYNWDGTKSTLFDLPWKADAFEISDTQLAKMHRQGLAQEFNIVGLVNKTLSWPRGGKPPRGR